MGGRSGAVRGGLWAGCLKYESRAQGVRRRGGSRMVWLGGIGRWGKKGAGKKE